MNPIWPFNRRPREAKSVPPLVALSEVGEARWGSRDGAALTRDGYLANAIAYRAVRMVAEAAAAVPLVTAHEGASRLLRRPQPDGIATELFETAYSQLQLTGNAFLEGVRLEAADGGARARLGKYCTQNFVVVLDPREAAATLGSNANWGFEASRCERLQS
mgnify:CR=1 FL=1